MYKHHVFCILHNLNLLLIFVADFNRDRQHCDLAKLIFIQLIKYMRMKETTQTAPLTGQATEAEIEMWKRRFGAVFSTVVEQHIAYFKKPSRQQISYAMIFSGNPMKMAETLLRECFVGGSKTILDNPEYTLSAESIISTLVNAKPVEIAKL